MKCVSGLRVALLAACVLAGVAVLGCGGGGGGDEPPPPAGRYTTVAGGGAHSLAVRADDGVLVAWGFNLTGQLGTGNLQEQTSPVPLGTASAPFKAVAVAAGDAHSLALNACSKSGCTLYAWGKNGDGRVGNGNTVEQKSPVRVGTAGGWVAPESGVAHTLAAGEVHSLAIKNGVGLSGNPEVHLYAWGGNFYGQLGVLDSYDPMGADVAKTVPTKVEWYSPDAQQVRPFVYAVTKPVAVAAGAYHSLALFQPSGQAGGDLYAWGMNQRGQLGVEGILGGGATPSASIVPLQVGAGLRYRAIAAGGDHSLAVDTSGRLWAWGGNYLGQLGDGSTTDVFKPALIPGLDGLVGVAAGGGHYESGNQLAVGGHSLAVDNNGRLWAWGANDKGQLGLGQTTEKYIAKPRQVGTKVDWKEVRAGKFHSFARDAQGQWYGWGYNLGGQQGNGQSGTGAAPVWQPTPLR